MWNIFNIPHEIEEAETSLIEFYEFEDKNTTKNILIEIKEEEALKLYGKIKCIHCSNSSMEYFNIDTFLCSKCNLRGDEIFNGWMFEGYRLKKQKYKTHECHCICGNLIIKECTVEGECYKTSSIHKLMYDHYIENIKHKTNV